MGSGRGVGLPGPDEVAGVEVEGFGCAKEPGQAGELSGVEYL